jgi:hypothetical protein
LLTHLERRHFDAISQRTDATGSDPGRDDDGAVIPMFANYVFVVSAKLGREDDMSSN